jgi:hypothetical protein
LQHVFFVLYVIATAFAFARVEIEVEGPHGWAASLPTWRVCNRWTTIFYGCRPLTGYHLWVQVFVLLLCHLPFALGLWAWSWGSELLIASYFILFFIVEDFLWFVLNPAFGLRRFRREHIWWHAPTWWWVAPRDYWVFAALGVGSYLLSLHLRTTGA